LYERRETRLRARRVDADTAPQLAPRLNPLVLVAFGAERLHDLDRRQRLGRERGDLAFLGALEVGQLLDPAAVTERDERERRSDREGGECEHGVEDEADDGHPAEQQHRGGDRAERVGEQGADRVHVACDTCHEIALRTPVVEAERQPLQVRVDGHAQVVHDALAGAVQQHVGPVRRGRAGQRDEHHETRDGAEQRQVGRPELESVAVAEQPVDHDLQRPRLRQLRRGQDDRRERADGERAPVTRDERREQSRRAQVAAAHDAASRTAPRSELSWASASRIAATREAPA
jgi:hypothetical protein